MNRSVGPLDFWYHHVGVSVPDLEASVEWYRRVLGFELARRLRIESIPADVAILKHGNAGNLIEFLQAPWDPQQLASLQQPDA